jgi:putative transcriptional regulator
MAVVKMTLAEIKAAGPAVDRAKLDATTEEDVRRHMIEDGENPDADVRAEDIFSPHVIRRRLGMTAAAFASALGIPLRTLEGWETGRLPIDPPARSLLLLVARDPKRVLELLGPAK